MESSDQVRKERIISHMNKGHPRELSHYLRHYANASCSAAASPEMRDVDLQGMKISAQGKDYSIPFSPPLTSWADVKTRIIEMDTIARENLGISNIYITEFTPPTGFGAVVFGSVVFYFFCAAALPWVVPDTPLWELLEVCFPGGPTWFQWVVKTIFFPVVGIHVVECYFFNQKLHKHGVDPFTKLWFLWQLSCFLEGLTAFKRIGAIVAKQEEEKNAKKQ